MSEQEKTSVVREEDNIKDTDTGIRSVTEGIETLKSMMTFMMVLLLLVCGMNLYMFMKLFKVARFFGG